MIVKHFDRFSMIEDWDPQTQRMIESRGIQLVVDNDRQVLVGATSVGPHGGEVLGMLTLAVHAQTPIATLRSMIYAYPTFHRAVEDALNQL